MEYQTKYSEMARVWFSISHRAGINTLPAEVLLAHIGAICTGSF